LLAVVALSAALIFSQSRCSLKRVSRSELRNGRACRRPPPGDHRSLVLGTCTYAAFCLAYVFPSSSGRWRVCRLLCAGCCGSVLWTAQGQCFPSTHSRLHERAVALALPPSHCCWPPRESQPPTPSSQPARPVACAAASGRGALLCCYLPAKAMLQRRITHRSRRLRAGADRGSASAVRCIFIVRPGAISFAA